MTERWIFFPALVKACLVSMDTNVGYSRDPAWEKSVTVSLRDLFLMDA